MTALARSGRAPAVERVMDVVLGVAEEPRSTGPARRIAIGCSAALLLHAVAWVVATNGGVSLETWSAELAMLVHAELANESIIEVEPPPEPPPAPEPEPEPRAPPAPEPTPRAPVHEPQPPAQAAEIVTAEPSPNEPLDMTADAFVTGTARTYAGGATTSTGTNRSAVDPSAVGTTAEPHHTGPDLSRRVSLDAEEWSCPWPREAVAEDIYEEVVVLRVVVRADGAVEAARVLDDPGHGFGRAAADCARHTRFSPALDADGHPIRSTSPPIRVTFTR